MMNFQQLCEFLTCNQRYSYFTADQWVLDLFTPEDKAIAALEKSRDGSIKVFYPKSKYKIGKLTINEITQRLDVAISLGNIDMIKMLGNQLKELQDEISKRDSQ